MSEVRPRWDTDERGHGVADARSVAPYVDELRNLVAQSDWITEDAEAHLLPHIEQMLRGEPGTILTHTEVVDGTLVLDLEVRDELSRGAAREAAHRVVAAVAESATLVRQLGDDHEPTFEVVTGMPPGTTSYATHGHRLTIRIKRLPPTG